MTRTSSDPGGGGGGLYRERDPPGVECDMLGVE